MSQETVSFFFVLKKKKKSIKISISAVMCIAEIFTLLILLKSFIVQKFSHAHACADVIYSIYAN